VGVVKEVLARQLEEKLPKGKGEATSRADTKEAKVEGNGPTPRTVRRGMLASSGSRYVDLWHTACCWFCTFRDGMWFTVGLAAQ
jgi:hypothetical protein